MEKILKHFNDLFKGKAKAVINKDRLEITIDGVMFIVSLPDVIGAQSE